MEKRRLFTSIVILITSSFLLVFAAYSWLSSRSGEEVSINGFSYNGNVKLLKKYVNVETKYKDIDGNWTLIASDIVADTLDTPYSKGNIHLTPGYRTEFETKITNISNKAVSYSSYFSDIVLSSIVADYITIGAYSPDVYLYDVDYFVADDAENPTSYFSSGLQMSESYNIEPGHSVTLKWYISVDSQYTDVSFLALADKDTGEYIIEDDNLYCVVEYSGFEKEVYHAYKVNRDGQFLDSLGDPTGQDQQFVEYSGDYSNCTYKYYFGNDLEYAVKLKGLNIAIGKKIEDE